MLLAAWKPVDPSPPLFTRWPRASTRENPYRLASTVRAFTTSGSWRWTTSQAATMSTPRLAPQPTQLPTLPCEPRFQPGKH